MRTICKHKKPSDICGVCNPLVQEDAPVPLDAAAGSPIPAIESAVLNIGTAISDCESARTAWVYDNWNDCTMWISNAIAQLEAARSKIYAHQEAENAQADPRHD